MYDDDSKSLVVAIYVHPSCIKLYTRNCGKLHHTLIIHNVVFDVVFFMHIKLADPTKANMILLSHITRKYISYISQKTHMRRRLVCM